MKRKLFTFTIALSLVGFVSPARAAYDIFMQIPGLTGESQDLNHKGWIDLYSFSHGMSKNSGAAPNHADFSIAKKLDKTSPPLDLKLNQGTTYPTITVEFQKAGIDSSTVFYRVVLENATITSIGSGGGVGADEVSENVSVKYTKISWIYYPIDQNGKVTGAVSNYWDVSIGKGG